MINFNLRSPKASARAASLALVTALLCSVCYPAQAQNPTPELSPAASRETAAKVVRWTGNLPEFAGKTVEVQFALFENASGGSALWSESQRVTVTADGHYSVLLGATSSEGLPATLFPAGESRWVAAHPLNPSGHTEAESSIETPRSLLAAVPYAFKSVDAETLAGRAASDYVTREDLKSSFVGAPIATLPATGLTGITAQPAISGTGTTNYLPIWTNSTTFGNSLLYQNGSFIGIGTTAPAATLDINGSLTTRGQIFLPAGGTATASTPQSSHSLQLAAASYSSSSGSSVTTNFKLVAVPTGNNTTNPSALLSLFYGAGSNTPAATGLSIATSGRINFAAGQTFPGTGPGTITKIVSNSPLTGGGSAGSVTLGLSTSALETTLNPYYAQLNSANNFTGNQTTTGSIGIGTAGPDAPLDIEAPNVGQAILISAGGSDSWAINSFGGSGSDGLAGRFIGGGTGGGGIAVGGGSTSDNTTGGLGASISGGYSYDGEGGDGIDVYAGNIDYGTREGYAGNFSGSVYVSGDVYGAAKYFRIDHPTDPTNKYLNHVSTESSEMMNIYSGNVTTDAKGLTTVTLPSWFETVNTDFRYQLTVVGQFAQAIVKSKIANGEFTIMTNAPNVEVSWMITALRNDRYAKAHPIVVEQAKPANERGFYIHPELYGQPATKQSEWGRHPRQMLARQQALKGQRLNATSANPTHLPASSTRETK